MRVNNPSNAFVPGRNLVFLIYASSLAYTLKADAICCGIAEEEIYSHDCYDATIQSLQQTVNLGLNANIKIETLKTMVKATNGDQDVAHALPVKQD